MIGEKYVTLPHHAIQEHNWKGIDYAVRLSTHGLCTRVLLPNVAHHSPRFLIFQHPNSFKLTRLGKIGYTVSLVAVPCDYSNLKPANLSR